MTALPAHWTMSTLGQVAAWSSGGTPKARAAAYYGGGIPWAVIGDLNDGLVTETAGSITRAGLDNSSAKWVPEGSVLVAMYGSIGKLGIAALPLTTNQAIAAARPDPEVIDTRFLFHYLMGQRHELGRAGKGAAQQNIGQGMLKSWPIALPPLTEQRRIVEILEDQLSRLDAAMGYTCTAPPTRGAGEGCASAGSRLGIEPDRSVVRSRRADRDRSVTRRRGSGQ